MTTRELFEAEFPVPETILRDESGYIANFSIAPNDMAAYEAIKTAKRFTDRWIGFQAGVKTTRSVV